MVATACALTRGYRHAPVEASYPLVSVVFVAYNRRKELQVSLEKVLNELDYPSDSLEVIVVDNASQDGTAEMVRERFPRVQLIRNPENVGASAWNVGISTARGEWRLILDDDCYIEGDTLKRAVRRAEEHRADLVSFLVASSEEEGYFNEARYSPGLLGFWGCSAMFSRRATEQEPFYDPNLFIWGNEVELTMRLLDRGFRHLYLPEAVSVHQKPLPQDEFSLHFATLNNRHWAYAAGKLMQPADAAVVLTRLVLRSVIDAHAVDRRLLLVVPQVLAGFFQGLRNRRPLRPVVSSLYREVCVDFSSPFSYMRTPAQRLRGFGDPAAAQKARDARLAARQARHARYYPTWPDVLEV